MITSSSDVVEILLEAEREVGRYSWEGTFADYLKMVSEKPSVSRLSHKVVYDAIMDLGVEESAHVLEVSPQTVRLDWRMARGWLRQRLER